MEDKSARPFGDARLLLAIREAHGTGAPVFVDRPSSSR
jgi:hypothetical protein